MKNLLVFICLFISFESFCCSCNGTPDFCESAQNALYNVPGAIMIKCKILNFQAHGMSVEVLDQYLGEGNNDTVKIWGDNGFLCRWYVDQLFAVGDTAIITALPTNGGGGSLEAPEDYMLWVCGTYFMFYKNGFVSGRLHDWDTVHLTENQFRNSLICLDSTTSQEEINQKDLFIYPNPSNGELNVTFSNQNQNARIIILDELGRKVYEKFTESNKQELDLGLLPSGLYTIYLYDSQNLYIRKWVKSEN